MKNRINRTRYLLAYFRNFIVRSFWKMIGLNRYKRERYNGKKVLDINATNDLIYNAILDDKPFLAARFGAVELRALVYSVEMSLGMRTKFPDYIKKTMQMNAGFFPCDDDNMKKFGEVLWNSATEVDLYGVWYNFMEDFMIKCTNPDASIVELESLEPYRGEHPWSRALKGKKVLVVHPFEDSIKYQYERREKIFENKNILPDFYLMTYKAVQTNAGMSTDYDTWFDALYKMYEDISKLDFDVAIVGCGAYGLPLAAMIKQLDKKVIHLAGATQILFGIRGARWDVRPEMQRFFNEYWIRPNQSERPKDAGKVEGGCYW